MTDLTAQADIVNTALIALGKEDVADLSDASLQRSVAARKVLKVLDRARRTVLRKNGWTCALEYVTLYPSTVPNLAPVARYPTTFLLPGDAVRVWEIEGVPCQWNTAAACYPFNAWEPRWQVGTTEVNGSTQLIIRGAVGPGDGMLGDGIGYPTPVDYYGTGFQSDSGFASPSAQALRLQCLNPLVYVRLADWGSLDPDLSDLIAYEAAARAAFSVTADLAVQQKLDAYVQKRLAEAVGADATQEGGQPEAMPSIPMAIRNLSR